VSNDPQGLADRLPLPWMVLKRGHAHSFLRFDLRKKAPLIEDHKPNSNNRSQVPYTETTELVKSQISPQPLPIDDKLLEQNETVVEGQNYCNSYPKWQTGFCLQRHLKSPSGLNLFTAMQGSRPI
jgi:hypothetical protein